MKKAVYNIMPDTIKVLEIMGEQIKLARLRRKISVNLACERAGISRATYWKIEKGDPSVAIGFYAAALHAINGMDNDLLLIGKDDILGHTIQDIELANKYRRLNNEEYK